MKIIDESKCRYVDDEFLQRRNAVHRVDGNVMFYITAYALRTMPDDDRKACGPIAVAPFGTYKEAGNEPS